MKILQLQLRVDRFLDWPLTATFDIDLQQMQPRWSRQTFLIELGPRLSEMQDLSCGVQT